VSHLIALAFNDQFKGEEARAALYRMVVEGLLEIKETVLICKGKGSKVTTSREDQVVGTGQQAGHVAGLVAAAITGTFPFILAGTLGGRLVGRLMDEGITNTFIQGVKQELQPGTSALIVLGESDPERRRVITERLRVLDPRVLESDLPPELQQQLEDEINDSRAA